MDNNECKYIVLPKATIRPNKIVFYNQFIKKESKSITVVKSEFKKEVFIDNQQSISFKEFPVIHHNFDKIKNVVEKKEKIVQPKSNKHSFEISKKAANRIKEKVSWLYTLAKNQTVTTHNGKVLYSFKMNFVTLTIPTVQKHSTDVINNECLNQFLTECKKKFGLENYVWRLEFQKNGNAHYHIATDSFIEYWEAKKIWNRCLEKLGYVSDYQKRFEKMDWNTYYKLFHNPQKEDFKILNDRYVKGCASKWSEPNTVDVRVVTSSKNIAFYIAKYITKKSDAKINPIVSKREPVESNLRLWFCCRSLSRLDKIEIFLDAIDDLTIEIFENLKDVKNLIYDYCNVLYYNVKEQTNQVKKALFLLFNSYAKEKLYFKT